MNRKEIIDGVQLLFDDIFLDPPTITDELSADMVDEWDSLLQISLIIGVEARFNIKFMTAEVEETANVGEFVDLILSKCIEV